ncbi:unnamed protein product [Musa textilis]
MVEIGRRSNDESKRDSATQDQSSVRLKVDSKECHNAAEANLPIMKKGCRCETTDSSAMGVAVPWYRRGGTSGESSIPCSHRGRALGRRMGHGGGECFGKLHVPRQG